MAKRRVDTRFVLILASVLLVVGGGVAAFLGNRWLHNRNPVWLEQQAKDAESRGDLDSTLKYYGMAWVKTPTDKVRLGMKLADLNYDNSDKDLQRYQGAMIWWGRVVSQDPKALPAQVRLLKELHDSAPYNGPKNQVAAWRAVKEKADEVIRLDPKNGQAYQFRGEAILQQASLSAFDPQIQASAHKDFQTAVSLRPDDVTALTMLASLDLQRAAILDQDKKASEATKLRQATMAGVQAFCDKHPDDAAAWLSLGRFHQALNQRDEARKAFEHARGVGPKDKNVYETLANFAMQMQDAPGAEANYQKLVEMEPGSLSAHYQLGRFYQRTRNTDAALKEFTTVLGLRGNAKGIEAIGNEGLLADTLYQLCGLNMELAVDKGAATPAGKAALRTAREYIDMIKGKRANDPKLFLYEGRLQLLNGHLAAAIAQLRQADAIFNAEAGSPTWFETKLLLAQAYGAQLETGSALDYLTQITQRYPAAMGPGLQRASLLLKMNRLTDSRDALLALRKVDVNNESVTRLLANVYYELGEKDKANKLLEALPSADAAIAQARMQLLSGNDREALELAKGILEKDPDSQAAIAVVLSADLKLADAAEKKEDADALRADARKYVELALKKNPGEQRYQILSVLLNNPGKSQLEIKKLVIQGIADPYDRAVAESYLSLSTGDLDKQIESLQQAEGIRPESQEIVDRIFNAALYARKWDLAARYAQKAEQLDLDGVKGRFFKGRLEMARGQGEIEAASKEKAGSAPAAAHLEAARTRIDAGLKILKEATIARPDFSVGWTILGQAYMQVGQYGPAREALEHAISERPDSLPALKSIISLCMTLGNDENVRAAQTYLGQALKVAPRDPELRSYDDLIGEPRAVIARREKVRQQNPEDWENLRRLAVGYVRAGEPAKAVEVLLPVRAKFPDDLTIADALARLYRDMQQPDAALKIYEPFLANKDPKIQYTALLSTAGLYRSLGQTQEAIRTYQLALVRQPEGSTEAQRHLADLYFDTEDMAHAEELYRSISEKTNPKDPRVERRLIETWIRENKYALASDALNKLLKATPDDASALVLRGYAQLKQGKADDAIKTFGQVLNKNPDNTDALHYRAFAEFFRQGNLAQAVVDLKHVRAANEGAINSRLLLARVYRLNRQYSEAAAEYQAVLVLRPDMVNARLEYADYLFSLAGAYLHMAPKAQDSYAVALRNIKPIEGLQTLLADSAKRFPTQPVWLVLLGDLQTQIGNASAAQQLYRQAYELGGRKPEVAMAYLGGLLKAKNYDRVIEECTRLLQGNPDVAELYVKRGTALGGQGHNKEALADFDKALDLATQNIDQFVNIVRQMFLSVPADVSIPHLNARLAADPKNLGTRIGLAQVLLSSDHNLETVQVLEPLMADKESPVRPLVLRMAALAHYQAHEIERARELYEDLLKIRPDDLETLNNLAFLLAEDLKRPADALPYAARAVKVLKGRAQEIVYVNNGNVMDTYGWVLFLSGDSNAAVEELSRSLQTDPMPVTYLHMGAVLQKQKKLAEARKMLEDGRQLAIQKKDPILPQIEKAQRDLK